MSVSKKVSLDVAADSVLSDSLRVGMELVADEVAMWLESDWERVDMLCFKCVFHREKDASEPYFKAKIKVLDIKGKMKNGVEV